MFNLMIIQKVIHFAKIILGAADTLRDRKLIRNVTEVGSTAIFR
jgi:hypothetical protein